MKKKVHVRKILAIYLLLNNFTLTFSQNIYTIDLFTKLPIIKCNSRECAIRVQMRTNFMPSSTWSRIFTNKTVQVLGNSIPSKYTAATTSSPPGCQPQVNCYCNITITLVINELNEEDFGQYEGTFGTIDKDEETIPFCIPNAQSCEPGRLDKGLGISSGDESSTRSGKSITIPVNNMIMYLVIGAAVIIALTLFTVMSVLIIKRRARKARNGNDSSNNKTMDIHETSHMYDEIPSIGYEDTPARIRQNSHQYTVPVTQDTSTYNDPAKVNPKPAPIRYIRRDTQGYLEPTVLPSKHTKSCVGNPTYIDASNKQKTKEPVQPTYSNPLPVTDSRGRLNSKESLRALCSNPIYREDKGEPSTVHAQREPLVRKSSNHLKVPSSGGRRSFRSPSTSSDGSEPKLVKTGSQKRFNEISYGNTSLGKNESVYINIVPR